MIAIGQVWRHKKRGGQYVIVDDDAGVQIAPDVIGTPAANYLEAMAWISYRSVEGGRTFQRPRDEFLDGRFELVAP